METSKFKERSTMRTSNLLLALFISLILLPPVANPATSHSDFTEQQKFEEMDRKWQAAEKNGDVDYLEKFFADSYVLVMSSGKVMSKNEWLGILRSPDRPILQVLSPDQIQVHVFPNVVILNDHTTIQGHDSKGQVISGEFAAFRVLIKQNGEWKAGGASLRRLKSVQP